MVWQNQTHVQPHALLFGSKNIDQIRCANPNLPGLATEVRELPTGVLWEKYVLLTIGRKIHWLVKRKIQKKRKRKLNSRSHCRTQKLGVVDSAGSGHRSRRNPSSTRLTARSPFTSKDRNPDPRYSNTERRKRWRRRKKNATTGNSMWLKAKITKLRSAFLGFC